MMLMNMYLHYLVKTYASLRSLLIKGIRPPAFDNNRIINKHNFMVFEQPSNYDILLGGDFLIKIGMNLNYADLSIGWLRSVAPMDSLHTPEIIDSQRTRIMCISNGV